MESENFEIYPSGYWHSKQKSKRWDQSHLFDCLTYSYIQLSLPFHLLGVLVGFGVELGLGVFVTTGVADGVAVAVAVGPRGQVVSLKRKLIVSSGALPAWPATGIVTLGSKFVKTIRNTSEAPFLKLLNLGRNSMLAKPGLTRVAVKAVRIRGERPDRLRFGFHIPLPVESEFLGHDR
jgi:hypothetical protein